MHKKLIDMRKTFKTITNQSVDLRDLAVAYKTDPDTVDDSDSIVTTINPCIDVFEAIYNELNGLDSTVRTNIFNSKIEFIVFKDVSYLNYKKFQKFSKWEKFIDPNELVNLLYTIFVDEGLLNLCKLTCIDFIMFMNVLSYSYNRNTYHNIYHALDIAVRGYFLYKKIEKHYRKCKLVLLSLLLGCLLHDAGHLGLKSPFLSKHSSLLVKQFGKVSLNEKMHFYIAKILLQNKEYSLIRHLVQVDQADILSNVEKIILSTDLAMHNQYKEMLNTHIHQKVEIIIKGPSVKMSHMELITIIKVSDISNSTTEYNYYNKTSNLVIAEENEERCLESEFPWALDSNESHNFKLKFIEIYALDYFKAVGKRYPEFEFLYQMALKNGELLKSKVDTCSQ